MDSRIDGFEGMFSCKATQEDLFLEALVGQRVLGVPSLMQTNQVGYGSQELNGSAPLYPGSNRIVRLWTPKIAPPE